MHKLALLFIMRDMGLPAPGRCSTDDLREPIDSTMWDVPRTANERSPVALTWRVWMATLLRRIADRIAPADKPHTNRTLLHGR
jgi:hypothetical protein